MAYIPPIHNVLPDVQRINIFIFSHLKNKIAMENSCQEHSDDTADPDQDSAKRIRKCSGYENISNEQARSINDSIKELSLLMYLVEANKKTES